MTERYPQLRILVAGARGMVGSAIVRRLTALGYDNLLTPARDELDWADQAAVCRYFAHHAIDQVYVAAAKVGGIHANDSYPAEFLYQNLMIECNLVHQAFKTGVGRLLFLGSSCIYPKNAVQPMVEEALLTGTLEPTNEPYAIAKIAGIKLCESYARQYGCDFRSLMPTNLYGENDNFHAENSHVIPALMQRLHEAKVTHAPEVVVWGSGAPQREFLHVDDLASACVHVMELPMVAYASQTTPRCSHLNVGTGTDLTIGELAMLIAEVVDFRGDIRFDTSKPDGAPRKLLDVSRLKKLGWASAVELRDGLSRTYAWYLTQTGLRS